MTLRAVVCPSPGRVTQTKLRTELLAAGVPLGNDTYLEPLNCYYSGEQFVVVILAGDDAWDATVRQVVAAHAPESRLPQLKAARAAAIDARTRELVGLGLPWNGAVLSLSVEAQLNWTNLFVSRGMLAYPLEVSTLAGGSCQLVDAAEVESLYAAGLAHVKAALDAGRQLKLAVAAAASEEELAAIDDRR